MLKTSYEPNSKERNEEPEKPFSGKFNLRLTPELHREVYVAAKHGDIIKFSVWAEI